MDVKPIRLRVLVLLALATFSLFFLAFELADPRWIQSWRQEPEPVPVVSSRPPILMPLPSPLTRRSATPSPQAETATPGAVLSGSAPGQEFSAEPGDFAAATAVIVETGGSGARLRAAPGPEADVWAVLAEGDTVELTGQEAETSARRWLEVRSRSGVVGWVAAGFLALLDSPPQADEQRPVERSQPGSW